MKKRILSLAVVLIMLSAVVPLTALPALAAEGEVVQIATRNGSFFVLKTDGSLWAWGDASYGTLGINMEGK